MDLATIIGLIIGFGSVILVGFVGGIDPKIFFSRWDAFVLIIGGSIGATVVSFPGQVFVRSFFLGFKTAFTETNFHERDIISTLVSFAEKARREGLLALENEAAALDDEFLRKGVQLVIDGRDTEVIRKVLETEVSRVQEVGAKAEAVFMSLGGYSPTLGIIGTVLGLIGMLKGLASMGSGGNVAGNIGVATAVAFVATFYGIMFANLLWLPIGSKIKEKNAAMLLLREIEIEGILAIQAGDNPRLLEEKLLAFLDPAHRELEVEEGGSVAAEPGLSGA